MLLQSAIVPVGNFIVIPAKAGIYACNHTAADRWAPGFAATPCEEVVKKIEEKLEKKGVKDYTLTVIPADEATELRVVGTCEAGKKKIVYKRGAAKE